MTDTRLDALRAAVPQGVIDTRDLAREGVARDLWPLLTLSMRDSVPRPKPLAVARPREEHEVGAILEACQKLALPVVVFGSGSGVCGGAAGRADAIALDVKLLDRIEQIDVDGLSVTVGPGRNLLDLELRLNDRGLTLGHFPSSIACASVGGAVAARGAGQLSSRYGKIEDMVTGLRAYTPGLGLLRTGSLDPEAGPDWTQLLVGAEGTLCVITGVRLRVWPLASRFVLRGVRFPNVEAGLRGFRRMLQGGLRPSVMRLYDPLDTWMAMTRRNDRPGPEPKPGGGHPLSGGDRAATAPGLRRPVAVEDHDPTPRFFGVIVQPGSVGDAVLRLGRWGRSAVARPDEEGKGGVLDMLGSLFSGPSWKDRLKPEQLPFDRLLAHPGRINAAIGLLPSRCLGILGCEGEEDADEHLRACVAEAAREGAVDEGPGPGERWFRTRYHVSFKLPKVLRSGAFADTMETAAPWSKVHAVYESVRRAVRDEVLVMAHASHAYVEGCSLYFTLVGHGANPMELERRYRRTWDLALDAVLRAGGTLSHHHGVGELKRSFMDREHGAGRVTFEATRRVLDPRGILNPDRLYPTEAGPSEAVAPPRAGRSGVAVAIAEDAVAEVGPEIVGADAFADLNRRGHFVWPLGREALERPVGAWIGPVTDSHAIHGSWSSPILGGVGLLPSGRAVRGHKLPRAAAGPSFTPLLVRGTGLQGGAFWLRAAAMPSIRAVGFRFAGWTAATTALKRLTRLVFPPLASQLHPELGPVGFRLPLGQDLGPSVCLWLAWASPDGVPSAVGLGLRVAEACGGEALPDDEALAWWEDHWAQAAREGAVALSKTGPLPDPSEIGRVAAAVPWPKALLLKEAIESLCGGPVRGLGWFDGASPAGLTLRVRFASTRPEEPAGAWLVHQIRDTVRVMGGRLLSLDFRAAEDPHRAGLPARLAPQAGLERGPAFELARRLAQELEAS